MVRLVPMENDAIPMVLLVQNKFTFTPSKNALIIIMNVPRSIRKPRKTSSLLHQVKARYNSYEYSTFYKPTMQNKFAFTPSKNVLIIMNMRCIFTNRTIGIGCFCIGTNRTIGTNGPLELPCTQLDNMRCIFTNRTIGKRCFSIGTNHTIGVYT